VIEVEQLEQYFTGDLAGHLDECNKTPINSLAVAPICDGGAPLL
jgi:hypothetical protein